MRVLLVPNTRHPGAVAAAAELSTWLLGQGLEPVLSQPDATDCALPQFGVAPSELGELALTVALGGDGTILKAVHLLGGAEVPVLGVKFGRLGFLSGASPERTGIAAGVLNSARQVGGAFGVALFGSIIGAAGPNDFVLGMHIAIALAGAALIAALLVASSFIPSKGTQP